MNCDNFPIMKVSLAQFSPHLGNTKKNADLHLQMLENARKENIDLLIFPELSLTGYTLKDLVPDVAQKPEDDPLFQEFKRISQEISFVVGFVEEKEKGLFFNSAAYFSRGEMLHIHRKVFLPTYGMFEEARFYGQGKNFKTFTTPFCKTGMMICYDFLHYSSSYLLFTGGSEMIIIISSAPGRGFAEGQTFATSHMWELMGETISRFSQTFLLYCNRVGFEDGKPFAGGSFIYNPVGQLIARASYTDEEFLVQEINLDEIRTMRKKWPYKRDDKPEIILEALKRIVKEYED